MNKNHIIFSIFILITITGCQKIRNTIFDKYSCYQGYHFRLHDSKYSGESFVGIKIDELNKTLGQYSFRKNNNIVCYFGCSGICSSAMGFNAKKCRKICFEHDKNNIIIEKTEK